MRALRGWARSRGVLRLRFQLIREASKSGWIEIVDQARDAIDLLNVGGGQAERGERAVESIELVLLRNAPWSHRSRSCRRSRIQLRTRRALCACVRRAR